MSPIVMILKCKSTHCELRIVQKMVGRVDLIKKNIENNGKILENIKPNYVIIPYQK